MLCDAHGMTHLGFNIVEYGTLHLGEVGVHVRANIHHYEHQLLEEIDMSQ